MSYLVAIPAQNAADTLGGVLRQLARHRDRVIVIDDGSTDMTGQVAERLGFTLLRNERNKGVGGALKTAIAHTLESGYRYLVTLDADGQHAPDQVSAFQEKLRYSDFVIGNRFSSDLEQVHDSKLAANLAAALTVNVAFGVRLADVACGYRAFRCADWMLELPSDGYGFLYEQLIHSLERSDRIEAIDIPPIFVPSTLWATRASEIHGFLLSVLSHPRTHPSVRTRVADAALAVSRREDFVYEVSNHMFHCLYVRTRDCYFVQTDVKRARRTMESLAGTEAQATQGHFPTGHS